jgi:hypothetical protein
MSANGRPRTVVGDSMTSFPRIWKSDCAGTRSDRWLNVKNLFVKIIVCWYFNYKKRRVLLLAMCFSKGIQLSRSASFAHIVVETFIEMNNE